MSGNDGLDAPNSGHRLRQRPRVFDAAAAIVGVHDRRLLGGKKIARVHDLQRREDHQRVAVGVTTTIIVEIDLIVAL